MCVKFRRSFGSAVLISATMAVRIQTDPFRKWKENESFFRIVDLHQIRTEVKTKDSFSLPKKTIVFLFHLYF